MTHRNFGFSKPVEQPMTSVLPAMTGFCLLIAILFYLAAMCGVFGG